MRLYFPSLVLVGLVLAGLILLILPLCLAEMSIFKQETNVSLIQSCNNCTYCNLTTIQLPDGTTMIKNEEMTKDGTSYNYNLSDSNITQIGLYQWCFDCGNDDENVVGCIPFEIAHAGVKPTTAQSGMSIAIIITIIFIMFFFGFIAFKLMDYEKMYPIALFFLLVAIIIAVYGLYLGVVYSRDYLYASTSEPQSKLFTGILFGLVGMTFIGLLGLIVMAIKEIRERKSMQRHGDGWNPKTKKYNY